MRLLPSFVEALIKHSDYHRNLMAGVWIVDTMYEADSFARYLKQFIASSDALFVAQLKGGNGGFMTMDRWDWLSAATQNLRF
jgi:hypothetical protein